MKIPFLKNSIILIFIVLFLTIPQISYSSEVYSVQAGALSSKKNAQNLVKKLKKKGIKCTTQTVEGLHKVYCGKFSKKSDANALKKKLSALGYKHTFIVSRSTKPSPPLAKLPEVTPLPPSKEKEVERPQEPSQEKISKPEDTKDMPLAEEKVIKPVEKPETKEVLIAQESIKEPTERAQPIVQERAKEPTEMPIVQEKSPPKDVTVTHEEVTKPKDVSAAEEGISGDIFERRAGYLHPFLSIGGYYTDNVFNTKDDKKDDFVGVISPGFWISVPRIKQRLPVIETSTTSPGGLTLSRMRPEFFRRYQLYLLYKADIEHFSRYSSENFINQLAEGIFQYNLRGGLSFEFADQFARSHDIRGTGLSKELDTYNTNLFNVTADYDLSEKFKIRTDYSNYLVHYDASRNEFRDRVDNAFSGYVFYKFQPATATFVQYRFITIDYDKSNLSNSNEHHFLGGLMWDITAKSRGGIRAGYSIKNFSSDLENNKEFIIEADIDHNFTPKTSLRLTASRRTNETNIAETNYTLSNNIGLEYRQRFTSKISGALRFSYALDIYKGDLTYGGVTKQREDNLYGAGISLEYDLKEWLKLDAGYTYDKRDSSFPDFDYTNNTIFFRIAGSL